MSGAFNRLTRGIFLLTTLLLLSAAIFYFIADFGRARTRLFGFVLLFLCIMFAVTRCSTAYSFPFLVASAVTQLPALVLYAMGAANHFNWLGVAYPLDPRLGTAAHALFFALSALLACAGRKGWRTVAEALKKP